VRLGVSGIEESNDLRWQGEMTVSGEWFGGLENDDGDGIDDGEQDGPGWVVAGPSSAEVDQVHPDVWDVREGVNYVRGWREGQRLARRLYALLARLGIGEGVEFTPGVLADGTGVVSGRFTLDAVEKLVELLEALRERREAAPKCRGPDDRAA
jgi:hypothetical protein